jgi:hypothetical protein
MWKLVKWSIFLLVALSIVALLGLFPQLSLKNGPLAEGSGVPGSFEVLGDFGGTGQYCYKRTLFSERFAARIERFSIDDFREFSQKYYGDKVETSATSGLNFFERFLEEFPPECRIEPGALGWGVLGSGNFGKHGALQYFFSENEMVMILVGTKAF